MIQIMRGHFQRHVKREQGLPVFEDEEESKEDEKSGFQKYMAFIHNNGRKGEEVVALFLRSIFDEPMPTLDKYLIQYFMGMIQYCKIPPDQITQGLSSYLEIYQEQVMDLPNMPHLLRILINDLFDKKLIIPSQLRLYKVDY
mmetsp:Transcript_9328/g.7096  ORF Transcript_9328/g.7096 Transcript_9328/m.7096 type:complete len:142 (+) Transcript_9328:2419-2844(+)